MKKQVLAVVCGLSLLFAAGACKKKEEQPPVPQTGMPGQQQGAPGGSVMMPKGETTVVVPDAVKGKWKGVVLVVTDKKSNKPQEFTVNLNSDLSIPNSNLKITVGEYLPDFRMDGLTITSSSNETNNPAVGIKIFENEKEIFKGWLYAKFPTIHPFEHPGYSVALKTGVKKG
jgi:hypothetical protein